MFVKDIYFRVKIFDSLISTFVSNNSYCEEHVKSFFRGKFRTLESSNLVQLFDKINGISIILR